MGPRGRGRRAGREVKTLNVSVRPKEDRHAGWRGDLALLIVCGAMELVILATLIVLSIAGASPISFAALVINALTFVILAIPPLRRFRDHARMRTYEAAVKAGAEALEAELAKHRAIAQDAEAEKAELQRRGILPGPARRPR